MQSEKYENRWEITLDDFVGVLCRARMSEREAIQLIVEMYRPLMLKYANLNTGFDDDLYQEFVFLNFRLKNGMQKMIWIK